jgi:hypothetical protein
MRHVTLHSEFAERGVFYAVRIVSNTQYVVKGSRLLVLTRTSCIFRKTKISLKIGYTFLSIISTDNICAVQVSSLHIQNDYELLSPWSSLSLYKLVVTRLV